MKRYNLLACLNTCAIVSIAAFSTGVAVAGTCDQQPSHIDSMRAVLGIPEYLHLEWYTSRDGWDTLHVTDDFNRAQVGNHWAGESGVWEIRNGELVLNSNANHEWRYLTVFRPVYNTPDRKILSITHRWGKTADEIGIREGAQALMIDKADRTGSGYWLWPRWGGLWLWIICNGAWDCYPDSGIEVDRVTAHTGQPVARDFVSAFPHIESDAVYLDLYVNGNWLGTVRDFEKRFPKEETWYVGLFIHGESLSNPVDDFTVSWLERDAVAPAKVTDLRVVDYTASKVTLEWISPGDNFLQGPADNLELRYSNSPITTENFSSATRVTSAPQPGDPCSAQRFAVPNLLDLTKYYFALRVHDDAGNVSPVSNVVSATTLNAGIPDTLVYLSGCGQTGEAGATLPTPVTVMVTDRHGFPAQSFPLTFTVLEGGGSLAGQTSVTQSTDSNGRVQISWTVGTAAGANNLVEIFGDQLRGSPLDCIATVRAATPSIVQISEGGQQLLPASSHSAPLKILIEDRFGNLAPNINVTYSVASGGGELKDGNPPSNKVYQTTTSEAGVATAIAKASAAYGDTTIIVAKVTGSTSSNLRARFQVIAARPDSLAMIGGDQQSARVGTRLERPLRVRIVDLSGAPVRNYAVTFRVQSGEGKLANGSNWLDATTDDAGFAETTWTLGPLSGEQLATAVAKFANVHLKNSPFTFHALADVSTVSASHSTLEVKPEIAIPADSASAAIITVTLRDEFNNPVPGKQVEVLVSGSRNSITPSLLPSDENGIAQAALRSTKAEWKTVAARVDGSVRLDDSVAVQFSPLAPERVSAHRGMDQKAAINDTLPEPVVVLVSDRFGNPVEGANITLSVLAGGGKVIGNASVKSDSSGLAQGEWQLGPVVGANILQANATELSVAPVVFFATALPPNSVKEPKQSSPTEYVLRQNHPNPFNPETNIGFDLMAASQVSLEVYDMSGRLVRQLVAAFISAGSHEARWDGKDDRGRLVESGVYFYRLQALSHNQVFSSTRKLVLLK